MEEWVGLQWDRLISQRSTRRYPQARVRLDEVKRAVGILFRAMGGAGGLTVEAVDEQRHHARRDWWQRIAGSHLKAPWFWCDDRALRMPAELDLFPERLLNRELYLWLAALAALGEESSQGDWFVRNQAHVQQLLQMFPGLRSRYQRLLNAHLLQRPDPLQLAAQERAIELAIRTALIKPGCVATLPMGRYPPWPVPLWSHPNPPMGPHAGAWKNDADLTPGEPSGQSQSETHQKTRQAVGTDAPQEEGGLILHRFESIFSWADFVKVDRSTDEEEDLDAAQKSADDLDKLHVTRDQKPAAKRLRFDLDLPSEAQDETPLGEGLLVPEWDYRKRILRPNHCHIQPMVAANAPACELPDALQRPAHRLKNQFESLRLGRSWLRRQRDGAEVDLDAFLDFQSERLSGQASTEDRLYRDSRLQERDLACLLLADLSLSTDTWVNDELRVIDVIRDGLFLFAEALSATRDSFGLFGFSSRRREHVRFHEIKPFHTPYGSDTRGRIQALRPGFYTRMGAAIRHASTILEKQPAQKRLLLLLTDGKPNDIDQYEGRYGVEDTRMAILEAKKQGIHPFCVTIDRDAERYVSYLFGPGGFAHIHRASELPQKLPQLYARLTG
ncbi:MAG: VWA domain-containing protein [Magnetococcales bacterium]|nr:VWA domain-containing protein [Magnetococcales bacterium]